MYYKMIVAIFGEDEDVTYKFFVPQLRLVFVRAKKLMLGIMTLNWWRGKFPLEAKDLNEQYYGNALNVAIVPKQLG